MQEAKAAGAEALATVFADDLANKKREVRISIGFLWWR
jgi:hypothetical protein